MAARSALRPKHAQVSAPEIDWRITSDIEPSKVDGHPIRMVRFRFQRRGHRPLLFALTAEEAFDLSEEIGRAYDAVN